MLSDTQIQIILDFTSGELEVVLEGASAKIITFGHGDVRFELMIGGRTSIIALFISVAGGGAIVQYEIPVTSVTATPESYEPGGVRRIPALHFFGGVSGRRVLIIYEDGGKFSADPIWDGDPENAEVADGGAD